MSVGRERRIEEAVLEDAIQDELRVAEALHARGGGSIGRFDTRLHPRDRTGKWREAFNSPERTMMGPSGRAPEDNGDRFSGGSPAVYVEHVHADGRKVTGVMTNDWLRLHQHDTGVSEGHPLDVRAQLAQQGFMHDVASERPATRAETGYFAMEPDALDAGPGPSSAGPGPSSREQRIQAVLSGDRGQRTGAVVGGREGRWLTIKGKKKHIPRSADWTHSDGDATFDSPAGGTDVYRTGPDGQRELVSQPGQRGLHADVRQIQHHSRGGAQAPADTAPADAAPAGFDVGAHWQMSPEQRKANLTRLTQGELAQAQTAIQSAPGTTALGKAPGARRGEDSGGRERAMAEVMDEQRRRKDAALFHARSNPKIEARYRALQAMSPGEHRVIDGAYVKREADNSFTVHHGYGSERFRNRQNAPGPGQDIPDDYFANTRDARLSHMADVLGSVDAAAEGATHAPNIMMTPMTQAAQMESRMDVGDKVAARWTGNHGYHAGNAIVKRMNRRSAVVTIDGGPQHGQDITLPLHDIRGNNRWSVNNRIIPRSGEVDLHVSRLASTPISGGRLLQRVERDTGRIGNSRTTDGSIRFTVDGEGSFSREEALAKLGLPASGATPAEYEAWRTRQGVRGKLNETTEVTVERDDGHERRERRIEEAMCDLLADDPTFMAEAADSMAKASTPEPFSKSKTSNWVAKGGGLPAYIQHIAHALVEKRGMPESKAISMAIGIVKRWARGGGKVDANTRAAAAKALAEWTALKAKAHAA